MDSNLLKNLFNKVHWEKNKYYTDIKVEENLRNFLKTIRPKKTDKKLIRIGSFKDGGYLIPDILNAGGGV